MENLDEYKKLYTYLCGLEAEELEDHLWRDRGYTGLHVA